MKAGSESVLTSPWEMLSNALAACESKVTRSGDGWLANCPAAGHGQGRGDRNPSLSISVTHDGVVLLHCHAGCSRRDILDPLGLSDADLFPTSDHHTNQRQPRRVVVSGQRPRAPDPARMASLDARLRDALDSARLAHLATTLGLTVQSLLALGVGWDDSHAAWSFPMCDGDGHLVGFRLRLLNGNKLTVSGTHNGLFTPDDIQTGEQLLIAEGPTDTAALLDMDFQAVGRPSCSGGREHLCRLLQRLHFDEVVIAADRDEPGQRGAEQLAGDLIRYAPVRIVTPPAKDVRQWVVRDHASRSDVLDLIDRAPVRRLRVVIARAGGRA